MAEPYYEDDKVTLFHGDCLEVLQTLPDASVDAVVTDPPYGLEFMGKEWDRFATGRGAKYAKGGDLDPESIAERSGKGGAGPSYVNRPAKRCAICGKQSWSGSPCVCPEPQWTMDNSPLHTFQQWCQLWTAECLRVLKPGGHMLAFGGARTWHRLACAVEDAGFEVRDSIAWLYGSGFPKSLDVSKAIDKAAPRAGMFEEFAASYARAREWVGLTHREICERGKFYGEHNKGGASVNWEKGYNVPTPEQWDILAPMLGMSRDMWQPLIDRAEAERQITGRHDIGIAVGNSGPTKLGEGKDRRDIPATPDAERWQGWGTALKPAFEPVVVARKPLSGTVAANVLAHGTGALNIDACRTATSEADKAAINAKHAGMDAATYERRAGVSLNLSANPMPLKPAEAHTAGRWPTNVVLDDSTAAELDRQSGASTSRVGKPRGAEAGDGWGMTATGAEYDDRGGASRFFPTFRYEAKAPAAERPRVNGTAHPTVKPLDLMRWLVRLVTPPGGTVLEPFAGSGTTVEACIVEGFRCIAIEREPDYLPLILQRVHRRRDPVAAIRQTGDDLGLFDLEPPA